MYCAMDTTRGDSLLIKEKARCQYEEEIQKQAKVELGNLQTR